MFLCWAQVSPIVKEHKATPDTVLDVRLYRPLGGIADDEVRFYASPKVRNWANEVASATKSKKEGIDGLVEGFVRNLEIGFPSTVAVIGRTSAKLGMRSSAAIGTKKSEGVMLLPCALCGM